MLLQTKVDIRRSSFEIMPTDRMLFVGSCFADNIGKRFMDNKFRAVVNPYGVMYNPASILHTVSRLIVENTEQGVPDIAVFTLGTNHVYRLKDTGEIVDNCRKRPHNLFDEEELTIEECSEYLSKAVNILRERNADVKVIVTVSPIRYAKYGFHGSQLSKATLLLAADKMAKEGGVEYFPAYEIMNDELRDYRFYEQDMLHPSAQAVDYIYEQFKEVFFSEGAKQMEKEWQPIRQALGHRPFNAESEEYKAFLAKAQADEKTFMERWKL
ncbi:MAG: GSCFA domain-containing protein [Prevotella sp.]|nr:GSCFA domain-containing protein [Prevotella sp.]